MKQMMNRRLILIKKTMTAFCLLLLTVTTFAQAPYAGHLLRLHDDVENSRIFIVDKFGNYFITFNDDEHRIESFGKLERRGDDVWLEETTGNYRVQAFGNVVDRTGFVIVTYFDESEPLTIVDGTSD
jgi:hypothetical protein